MKKSKLLPLKERVNKVVPICGRRFNIAYTKDRIGGEFHTLDPETKSGKILIGEGHTDEFYQLVNIIHEIVEAVFTIRGLRWADPDQRMIFSMSHDQFTEAIVDLTRAIVETGLITVREPGVK